MTPPSRRFSNPAMYSIFGPAAIIDDLELMHPDGWSYQQTASYGHFGRSDFPWEKTDKVEALQKAAKTKAAA